MKKGILLTGVCVLAVAAGFGAGSLNSSAHSYVGGHHYENCQAKCLVTGGHHPEHFGNVAAYWEQCRQSICDSVTSAAEYCEPEATPVYCEPVYQENYTTGTHHTESHHGHGGRHH